MIVLHIFQNTRHVSTMLLFLFCVSFLIWFIRMFIKDAELKKFILGSLTDPITKQGSGKSITALMFSLVIALAVIIAVIYSPNHILPESFLNSILIFIATLYGIKVAGNKFGISGNGGDMSSITTTTQNTSTVEEVKKESNINKDENPTPQTG